MNSLLVSGLTTAAAISLGFVVALSLLGRPARWRRCGLAMTLIALALPPFLVTNCWLDLLGQNGAWHGWLPLNIYSLAGTVWVLTLMLWPVTALMVLAALQRLEASQLESDAALRGRALIWWLLWPMARPAFAQAAALTFVLALNNFAVPAILQVRVFPAEVWVSFSTNLSFRDTLLKSGPLLLAPLALLIFLRQREIAWPRQESAEGKKFSRQLGPRWMGFCGSASLVAVGLSVGLPLWQLGITRRTWTELWPALQAGLPAAGNTLFYAATVATLVVGLGLICGRRGRRWGATGVVAWLLFLLPGIFTGLALIYLLNRPWLDMVYHSAGVVLLAFTLRYLAIGWHGAGAARRGVDRDLVDAARLHGASGRQLLRHVLWPQMAPQLAAAWYVVYLLCLWDVETVVLIQPPGGETLALRVFNLLHYGHNSQVNALCLWLLALAVLPLLAWRIGRWIARRKEA